MHEFSQALQAVDKIMEAALNKGAKKILGIELLIGELSLLGKEEFIFCMKQILSSKGEIASDVRIDLKPVKAVIRCRHCGYEGNLNSKDENHFHPVRNIDHEDDNQISNGVLSIFLCPSCEQADIEIRQGRECVLNRIQLEI